MRWIKGAILIVLLVAVSCGKKMPPVAPESVAPEPVKDLRAISSEGRLLIVFNKPSKNVDGSKLTDLAGIKILRRVLEDKEGCKTCPEKFPVVYDIDMAYPKGAIVEGNWIAYTDNDVMPGVKYEYKVVAYNKDGYEGPESTRLSFLWAIPPSKPGSLKIKGGDKAVDLEWTSPDTLLDGSKTMDVIGYNIYRREGGRKYPLDPVNQSPVKETKFSDFGLKNERTYYYTVRAVNETMIEGLSADEVEITPKEAEIEELKGEGR